MKKHKPNQNLALLSLFLLLTAISVGAQQVAPSSSVDQSVPLTLDEALRLAATQASGFQQAALNERVAAEDVKQAQTAFLPRVASALSYIYTSPLLSAPLGTPRGPGMSPLTASASTRAL